MQQPPVTFHGLTLHCQLDAPSSAVAAEVVALWTRNRILPPGISPSERVRQVVIAALASSGRAVGVNTVYPGTLPPAAPGQTPDACWYYRMFIEPAERRPHLMRAMTVAAYDALARHRRPADPGHFAIVTDNMGLAGPGMLRLFARQDCHVRGRLPDGKLLLVRTFPGTEAV